MDPQLCALIKRHVVQVDAHNKYLEKKRMWREYEEEQAKRNTKVIREKADYHDTNIKTGEFTQKCDDEYTQTCDKRNLPSRRSHGILSRETPEHTDAFGGSSRSIETAGESGRPLRKRFFPPSFDEHAADRIVTLREKQRRLLHRATAVGDGDAWLPDKFYTHELQQPQPWVNPTEVLSRHLAKPRESSDDELTPKASTSAESSDHNSDNASTIKNDTGQKAKKKAKKKRSRSRKKKKKRKHKKDKV